MDEKILENKPISRKKVVTLYIYQNAFVRLCEIFKNKIKKIYGSYTYNPEINLKLGGGVEQNDLTAIVEIKNMSSTEVIVRAIRLVSPCDAFLSRYGQQRLGIRSRPISGAIPLLGVDQWIISAGKTDHKVFELKSKTGVFIETEFVIGIGLQNSDKHPAYKEIFIRAKISDFQSLNEKIS